VNSTNKCCKQEELLFSNERAKSLDLKRIISLNLCPRPKVANFLSIKLKTKIIN